MPKSSHKQIPEIPMRIRLLELAQRVPLFLSQNNQTYVACPTATPIYSEDFFTWLVCLGEKRLGYFPSPHHVAFVVRSLDAQAHGAKNKESVHTRIAKLAPKTYQIDLGTDDHQVINITGKQWQPSQHFDAYFERSENTEPSPTTEPTKLTLANCFEQIFETSPENSDKLALWLAEALLPDQKPPILVITGKAREAAIEILRQLIDPVLQPIIYTPHSYRELNQMALENQVLAFSFTGDLSPKFIKTINDLHEGTRIRLKQCSKIRPKLGANVQRPVLIATKMPLEISPNQITIEINTAHQTGLGKVFFALMDLVVQIVGQPEREKVLRALAEPSQSAPFQSNETPDSNSS